MHLSKPAKKDSSHLEIHTKSERFVWVSSTVNSSEAQGLAITYSPTMRPLTTVAMEKQPSSLHSSRLKEACRPDCCASSRIALTGWQGTLSGWTMGFRNNCRTWQKDGAEDQVIPVTYF